jgi:hypothetical protein
MLVMTAPPDEDDTVAAALLQAQRWPAGVPGVTGVGRGEHDGRATIDVWVAHRDHADRLPRQVNGLAVRVLDSMGRFITAPEDWCPHSAGSPHTLAVSAEATLHSRSI